jgi:hypothetical protein
VRVLQERQAHGGSVTSTEGCNPETSSSTNLGWGSHAGRSTNQVGCLISLFSVEKGDETFCSEHMEHCAWPRACSMRVSSCRWPRAFSDPWQWSPAPDFASMACLPFQTVFHGEQGYETVAFLSAGDIEIH